MSRFKKVDLLCFFSFFLIIDIYFLIPVVIAHICIPSAKLVRPTETQTNKENAEIVTQPIAVEAKISTSST